MQVVKKPRLNDHWYPFNEVDFCRISANRARIRRVLHPNRNKGFHGVFQHRTENQEEKWRLNWAIQGIRGLHYIREFMEIVLWFSMVLGDDQITLYQMTVPEGTLI
jgi:hypothetical protein